MLIDSIIGRLKSKLHEANKFLDNLIVGNSNGEITVGWRYGFEVQFQEYALCSDSCPDLLVLASLQDMVTRTHSEMERLGRAMGVQDRDLHPPRRPKTWFCKMCDCEVSDMTIAEHAVFQHNMADTLSL